MSSITLNNVCLDYIVKTGSNSIKKLAVGISKSLLLKNSKDDLHNSSFRALNNIDLQLNDGDRLGILGKNGAGKSTLLKILAKIYKPNFGTLNINGAISTLFDINLGMNPEASGYENVMTLGIMRKMTRKKILSLLNDIESFTELGNFLKAPVRTYSTGMQMKLAFSIATAGEPDIILIDEIISAGDFHFMKKANTRLKNIIDNSNILVLTSHANDVINRFCNKVIVLDQGEIKFIGETKEGIEFYQREFDSQGILKDFSKMSSTHATS